MGLATIQKGVVREVYAGERAVRGTLMSGAEFYAYYYGSSPVVADIVFIAPVADGSWLVITGPTSAAGLFGIGGDGDVTITASTTGDPASRVTSADGTMTRTSLIVTSASGGFTSADVGSILSGTGIPAGTYIAGVTNSTTITVSQYPTTGTASSTLTITRPNQRFTVSGSTFTLQRDLYCVNLFLDSSAGSFTLITNGFRIFCLGTLLIGPGVVVHNNGFAASGSAGGGNARAGTVGRAVGAGANGVASNPGNAGTAVTASAATLSTTAIQSGGQGGYAKDIGIATNHNAGGAGGTVANALANGWPGGVPSIIPILALDGTKFAGGAGGGGGAGRGTIGQFGSGIGGGGGGGGGVLAIFARQLVNLGTISANGGAGAAADAADATNAAFGGGGGGGGGVVVLVFGATGSTIGQVSAIGGTAGGGTAGSGGLGTTAPPPDFSIFNFPFGGGGGGPSVIIGPGAGTGGAAAAAGSTYESAAGLDGSRGLVWALPL